MSPKEKLKPKNPKFILTELKPNNIIYVINLKEMKIAPYMKQNKRINALKSICFIVAKQNS
jgi:hypothetical protein